MRFTKKIVRQGNTWSLAMTKELKALGYEIGDLVEVDVKPKEDGDMETQKN